MLHGAGAADIANLGNGSGRRDANELGPHDAVERAVPVDAAAIDAWTRAERDCSGGGPKLSFGNSLSTATISRFTGREVPNSAELSAVTP
jgi:hypothetical protein